MTETLPRYTIDTSCLVNFFRESHFFYKNRFVSLWDDVEKLFETGELISHFEVWREIEKNDDELKNWALKNKNYFKPHVPEEMEFMKEIASISPEFITRKRQSQDADPWLIAQASVQGLTIVTQEKITSPNTKSQNFKIPHICQRLSPRIKYMDITGLIDSKGWVY